MVRGEYPVGCTHGTTDTHETTRTPVGVGFKTTAANLALFLRGIVQVGHRYHRVPRRLSFPLTP